MDERQILPAFPLSISVCPGEAVPLHIFEPRYKAMIAHCRAREAEGLPGEFAIVLSSDGEWRSVGCAVNISKIIKTYEDGRMDLIAVGRRRYQLQSADEPVPYPTARAVPFDDLASDWDEALANEVFSLHRRLVRLTTGQEPPASDYEGLTSLSFHVMPSCGLSMEDKQNILELRSENDRLLALAAHLRSAIDLISRAHQMVLSVQGSLAAAALARGEA